MPIKQQGLLMKTKFTSGLRRASVLSFYAGLMATTAATLTFAQVPTAVDPSILEKRFEQPERSSLPQSSIKTVTPPQPAMSADMQKQLAKQRFVLRKVVVDGNTVYSDDQLKFAYEDMLGKEISLLDAQTIVKRITDYYRSHDYILSQAIVPSQNIKDGVLKIRVVEGFINDVQIQGDIKGDRASKILTAYAGSIKNERPIRTSDLERYLLLMDDLPGTTAKGVVHPSKTTPGAADLLVNIEHKTYEASYTVDNRGSKAVGPFQHSATFAANSILGQYDRTVARFITTSPTTELRFIDLQHEEQIGSEGTRLVFTGSGSHSEPGDSLKELDIRSNSTFFQAKLLHPFQRSRKENMVGRAIFDARNTETDVFNVINLNKDKLRVVRAGGNYDFADQWSGVNLFDAEIAHGLDIFGSTDENDNQSRTDVEPDFTKINFDITRTQPLPSGFSVFTAVSGQYAFDKLLAAEQFTLGGANFGRAYDPGELSGDHGIAGKIELRYGQGISDPLLQSYQVYGFYDVGRVWLRGAGPGENDKMSLASAGLGLRANFSQAFSSNVEVADPLTKPAANQGGHSHSPRLFFSVTGRF
jgi:hemolysin activation/secretion protein